MNSSLPIGTVVGLKGEKLKFFIVGFRGSSAQGGTIYDYIGYLYPFGFMSKDKTYLFNHSDIDNIYYTGYNSIEEKEFKEELREYVDSKEEVLDNEKN